MRLRSLSLPLLCLVFFTRFQTSAVEVAEHLRSLARYVGTWDVSWTEDGRAQAGSLSVEPVLGGSVLRSTFIQQERGRVVWSSLSLYFWRPDIGRIATLSFDSTGRREESLQVAGGDHEVWQGPGAIDRDGRIETAVAHTDWNGPDSFTWQARQVWLEGRSLADSPIERYQRRSPLPESPSGPVPSLQGRMKRLRDRVGRWESAGRSALFTPAAGGWIIVGELYPRGVHPGSGLSAEGMQIYYSNPASGGGGRLERLCFRVPTGHVLQVLTDGSPRHSGRTWQTTRCWLPGATWESGLEIERWNGSSEFALQPSTLHRDGVALPEPPSSIWRRR